MKTFNSLKSKRCQKFTILNVAISPISGGIFAFFSVVLHWGPVLSLIPMTLATTPLSYKVHRMKSFTSNELRWRHNLQRWAVLRVAMFLAGLGIMAILSSAQVSHFIALAINGTAQAPFGYLAAEKWALSAL